jgi:hypothetical protein
MTYDTEHQRTSRSVRVGGRLLVLCGLALVALALWSGYLAAFEAPDDLSRAIGGVAVAMFAAAAAPLLVLGARAIRGGSVARVAGGLVGLGYGCAVLWSLGSGYAVTDASGALNVPSIATIIGVAAPLLVGAYLLLVPGRRSGRTGG